MNIFSSRSRHVLYSYQDDLIVVTLQADKPVSVDQYVVSPGFTDEQIDGIKQRFSKFVADHQNDDFAIIVDTVDETHAIDEIPWLVYRDRIALIKKRLSQRFRGVEYASHRVVSRGRAKWNPRIKVKESDADVGKSNGEVFLTALTNSETLDFWLDVLLTHKAKIVQLTSPALLSTELLSGFASNGSGLLVSMHPAGLRQTLLVNGVVQFSRLGKINNSGPRGLEREIIQTLQYLQSSQRIPVRFYKDGGLGVWLLTGGLDDTQTFSAQLMVDPLWSVDLELIPHNAVCTSDTPVPKFGGLSPWVANVGAGKGWTEYTTSKLHRFSKLARSRSRLWLAGLGVAAVGLAFTAVMPFAIQHSLPNSSELSQQERAYKPILGALQTELSKYRVSSTAMRAVVQRAGASKARHISSRAIFDIAASGLAGDDDVLLEELQWRRVQGAASIVSNGGASGDDGGAAAAMADANFDQEGSGSTPVPMAQPLLRSSMTQPAIEAPPEIEITLTGVLQTIATKTTANQRVQDIATRLMASCNCQITRVELPFDPSPSVALTENFEKSGRNQNRFTVVALWDAAASNVLKVSKK